MKTKKTYFPILFVATVLYLITGCGKSSNITGPLADLSSQNLQNGAVKLQGTWASGCIKPDRAQGIKSGEASLTFKGNDVSGDITAYIDSSCSVPLLKEHQHGKYILGNSTDSAGLASSIDYNISDKTITLFDQRLVDAAAKNQSEICKLSKYQFSAGLAQDVSDQEGCLHQDWIGRYPYSIIKVEGNHLRLGITDLGNGRYPENRSNKISDDFLIKQNL